MTRRAGEVVWLVNWEWDKELELRLDVVHDKGNFVRDYPFCRQAV